MPYTGPVTMLFYAYLQGLGIIIHPFIPNTFSLVRKTHTSSLYESNLPSSNQNLGALLALFNWDTMQAAGPSFKVVVLGCGTGYGMKALQTHLQAQLLTTTIEMIGVDKESDFLNIASGAHPDYHFICKDASLLTRGDLQGPADMVVFLRPVISTQTGGSALISGRALLKVFSYLFTHTLTTVLKEQGTVLVVTSSANEMQNARRLLNNIALPMNGSNNFQNLKAYRTMYYQHATLLTKAHIKTPAKPLILSPEWFPTCMSLLVYGFVLLHITLLLIGAKKGFDYFQGDHPIAPAPMAHSFRPRLN